MITKLMKDGQIIEFDETKKLNKKLRKIDDIYKYHKVVKYYLEKPEQIIIDKDAIINFRNELHIALFLQNIMNRRLLTNDQIELFGKINQWLYGKYGFILIQQLSEADLKREMEIKESIKSNTFVYTGIKDIDKKVEKCQAIYQQ